MSALLQGRQGQWLCRTEPSRRHGGRALCVSRAVQMVDKNQAVQKLDSMQFINPMWSQVTTEQQFKGILQKMVDSGKLSDSLAAGWTDFYDNYKAAILRSGVAGADETLLTKVQASIADVVFNQFVDPYTFPSFHQRLLEPYNYYEFGQRYVGTLTDFSSSVLGYADRWTNIHEQLQAGHNVVLLANHQTEADPGVFAHMLGSSHAELATDVIYVAGDRVVHDPLCKPFSMGRNLFCVHSKKHMDDDPKLKAAKQETNRKTLAAMSRKLNAGGTLIWIAPSGGRDRPDAGGNWQPDRFDAAAVDLMRNLVQRAKQPGHLYPMAMYSWPMMPPPTAVEKQLGERRITHFTPVGISVCEELDPAAITAGTDDKEAAAAALAEAAHKQVIHEYQRLVSAIKDPAFRTSHPEYSQPWLRM